MNKVAISIATVAKNNQNTILPRVTVKKWAIKIEARKPFPETLPKPVHRGNKG